MTGPRPIGQENAAAIVRSVIESLDLHHGVDALEGAVIGDVQARMRQDGLAFVVLDEAGNPAVTIDATGHLIDLTPEAFIRDLVQRRSAVAPSTGHSPYSPEGWSLTRQALLEHADPEAASRLEAEADQASGCTNPFSKSGWNVTQQMVLERTNPTLAAKLEAEANRR